MKISFLSILVAVSTVSAATIPYLPRRAPSYKHYFPRQASSINATVSTINANTQALAQAVQAYQGGLLAATSISSKESALSTSLQQATQSIKAMPPLNSEDSKQVLNSINTLMPNIQASLTALTGRQSEIKSAGLSGIVSSDLSSLKQQTDDLGNAMVNIASADVKPQAMQKLQSIDAMFQPTIAAFGGA